MNIPHHSICARFKRLAAGGLFTAGLFFVGATAAFAALRQVPLVSVEVDNGVVTNVVHKGAGAPIPPSSTGGKASKLPSGTLTDSQSQMVYTITVRNLSSFPATNLAVEYHFYNKTSAHNAGTTTTTVDDVTSTVNVDIPVNGRKDIQTNGINHEIKQAYATSATGSTIGASSGKKGTMSSGQTDTTTTSVMGYVIIVRSGNTIVKTLLSKDDIVDQVKAIQARAASQ